MKTAILVSSQLDVSDLLREVAKQMTGLLDAHLCVISEFDPSSRTVSVLAEYDHVGNRQPDTMVYTLGQFPVARKVIEEQQCVTVNVSDPHADPAEVSIMRRDGDKSLLVVPMIHQGESIGLIEVLDHQRERRFSRQELRLANAVAGQAAVALHNAKVFSRLKRSDQDVVALRGAIEAIADGQGRLRTQSTAGGLLQEAAELAARALEGISCVASYEGESAGASGMPAAAGGERSTQSNSAHVIVSSAPSRGLPLTLTLTLGRPAREGQAELLGLIAAMAADALGATAGIRGATAGTPEATTGD